LSEASGGTVAAPIWQEYMTKIYDKKGIYKEKIYEEKPETIKEVTLCSLSGKLATDKCQETFTDYTVSDVEECDLHVTVNICNFSGMLQGNECPESAITQKDVLFVPLGSNLASIPEDIILEHYPNALIETVDSVCVSHVNGVNIPSAEQIGYSENLLTTLDDLRNNTLLEQQYIDLANYDYSSISDYIDRAKSALYNGAQESETFYTDYFTEYNRVKTDISNLQAIINNIVTTQQAQQAAIE
jgi:hypothetical protein